MDMTLFKNLIKIIDEMLDTYSQIKELFIEKKECLKHSKIDELGIVDNKIITLNNKIEKLNVCRTDLAKSLNGEDTNMSGIIAIAEKEAPEYVEILKQRKEKINELIPELTLLNKQNVELLKHGVIITGKMLETIVDAFAPQGCIYNGSGKTDSPEYDMWTINEEI